MILGQAFAASPVSYRWQLQLMPLQNVFQLCSVKAGLLEKLFDARLVLLPSDVCPFVTGPGDWRDFGVMVVYIR